MSYELSIVAPEIDLDLARNILDVGSDAESAELAMEGVVGRFVFSPDRVKVTMDLQDAPRVQKRRSIIEFLNKLFYIAGRLRGTVQDQLGRPLRPGDILSLLDELGG